MAPAGHRLFRVDNTHACNDRRRVRNERAARIILVVTGGTIAAYAAAMAWVPWETLPVPAARVWFSVLSVTVGAVYVLGLWTSLGDAARLWPIFICGVLARAILLPSTPFLVVDVYRYLWDGAVTAHGINPYRYSPQEVQQARHGEASVPRELHELGDQADRVLDGINFPELTTVYPPVTQLAFAAAHRIHPWSVAAWRAVLFCVDLATLLLLVRLLRAADVPVAHVAWYWWNPILLREVFGAGHMDVLAVPLVLATLLAAIRSAPLLASFLLSLAVGVKIWPLILLPLVLRSAWSQPRRLLAALAVFGAGVALTWWPVVLAATSDKSGFVAYARSWENNDAMFRLVRMTIAHLSTFVALRPEHADGIARVIVAGSLVVWIAIQVRRRIASPFDLVRRALLIVAALFVLSPTQFPWYYVWMLPLLACVPVFALLAYTIVLPLYYAHYDYPGVVWVEHVPILVLLAVEAIRARRDARAARVLVKGV